MKFSVVSLLDGVDLQSSRQMLLTQLTCFTGKSSRHVEPDHPSLSVISHEDERFRDELRGALTPYERTGELEVWDDTDIVAGQKWEDEDPGKARRTLISWCCC